MYCKDHLFPDEMGQLPGCYQSPYYSSLSIQLLMQLLHYHSHARISLYPSQQIDAAVSSCCNTTPAYIINDIFLWVNNANDLFLGFHLKLKGCALGLEGNENSIFNKEMAEQYFHGKNPACYPYLIK